MGNSTSSPVDETEVKPRKYSRRLSPGVDFQALSFLRPKPHDESTEAWPDEPTAQEIQETTVGQKLWGGIQKVGKTVVKPVKLGLQGMGHMALQTASTLESVTNTTVGRIVNTPRHLQNVFAKPLEDMVYKPPFFEKGTAESAFLHGVLRDHFVFANVQSTVMRKLVGAFEKYETGAGTTLITQGELATGADDYFYILLSGCVEFVIDGRVVGKAEHAGDSFGELALLYSCPRAATVQCLTDVTVYRIAQKAFRYILQVEREQAQETKIALLSQVPMFAHLKRRELFKLQEFMTPRTFSEGEVLCRKGDPIVQNSFVIIQRGTIAVTDLHVAGAKCADTVLGPGDYAGDAGIISQQERRLGTATAQSDGLLFALDKAALEAVLGPDYQTVFKIRGAQADAVRLLALVPVLHDNTQIDKITLESLVDFLEDRKFHAGQTIIEEGKRMEAALYFVKKGAVEISSEKEPDMYGKIGPRGFFGEELLRADAQVMERRRRTRKHTQAHLDVIPTTIPTFTATCIEDCTLQVLYLKDIRNVFDTTVIGAGKKFVEEDVHKIPLKDLKRHKILGAGTFGQVWLVSYKSSDPENPGRQAYALKIQSKYQLCQSGQARAVVREKNIMASLHHPFLASLVDSYQDQKCVYMLMGLVQGGELHAVIHDDKINRHGLAEADALFFAAGIHEGLSFMHRRGYVYRDLKPENVLVSDRGYPVIVDYGFMKYIEGKTYTFCGTPLYLPPEIILNQGHDWGADHWSFGVMLYEMLYGYTPFYEEGMDQMSLFKAIVNEPVVYPSGCSPQCEDFLKRLLRRRPTRRLGSRGENEIYQHAWFLQIDFHKLYKQEYESPYVPKVKNPLDVANFSNWRHVVDKSKEDYPPLTPEEKKYFEDF